MHVVIDYRPALRCKSGVGEYVHQVSRALRQSFPQDALTLITSSFKDRPSRDLERTIPGARISDHRVPGKLLNLAWHRLEWPPVEWCLGESCDVAFSPHPLLLPARGAAQIVMIHDLDFLAHPERTEREIRRDYAQLAGAHARRADRIITPSRHTKQEVSRLFDIAPKMIAVCPPGVPEWQAPITGFDPDGYLLFVGSLEPRKNIGGLLAAYTRLLETAPRVPALVLAGQARSGAADWLDAISRPPLLGRVRHLGYVDDALRQRLYSGARALVLPSFDEGFGMPVLEAMSLGIPVIASARGALPELAGDAGLLIDPGNVRTMAETIERVLTDGELAHTLSARGRVCAARYSWARTAAAIHDVCREVVATRAALSRSDATSRTGRRTAPGTATTRLAASRERGPTGWSPGS